MDRRTYLTTSTLAAITIGFPKASFTTGAANPLKVVVSGAHPDDPETGCGGLIALLADAGHEVVIAYLTRGEAGIEGVGQEEAATIRTAEAREACNLLGGKPHFLGQVDGSTYINQDAYTQVWQFLMDHKPDLILTHWPMDSHRDHRICSMLTYDAWLRMEARPALYYYEVMTGIQSHNFQPTDYVDITRVVNRKHQACFLHKSQKIESYYPNDHGRMEVFRGMEAGVDFAEAYVRHSQSQIVALPAKFD